MITIPNRHENLYQRALDAINNLFADQSVSPEGTAASLAALIDEIEMLQDILPEPDFDT